jgi:hypothetical protein
MDLNLLDLPTEILLLILKKKLSYKDLANLSQVNTQCRQTVRSFWQSKTRLEFNERTLILSDSFSKNDKLKLKPDEFLDMMESILKQTNWHDLKHLDASLFCKRYKDNAAFNDRFIKLIVQYCTNLTRLVLKSYMVTYNCFTPLPVNLTQLVNLNMRNSSINDYCLTYVLNDCVSLEKLNISKCNFIKGLFVENLYRDLVNLKSLHMDYCENFAEAQLISFLDRNGKYLTREFLCLGVKLRTEKFGKAVARNLTNCPVLSVQLNASVGVLVSSLELQNLQNLVDLDLSESKVHNNEISQIMHNCLKLERLKLCNMAMLGDEAFTALPIQCCLSLLHLNNLSKLTDLSLEKISRFVGRSLRELDVRGCVGVTSRGLVKFFRQCKKLVDINVGKMERVMDQDFVSFFVENNEFESRAVAVRAHDCVSLKRFVKSVAHFDNKVLDDKRHKIVYNNLVFNFPK